MYFVNAPSAIIAKNDAVIPKISNIENYFLKSIKIYFVQLVF